MADCESQRLRVAGETRDAEVAARLAAATETASTRKRELRASVEMLRGERDANERELSNLRRDYASAERQLEHANETLRHDAGEKAALKSALDELTGQMRALGGSLDSSNRLVEEYRRRAQTAEATLAPLEANVERDAAALNAARADESRLRDENAAVAAALAEAQAQIERLRANTRPIGFVALRDAKENSHAQVSIEFSF